jgi:hypothetical protein
MSGDFSDFLDKTYGYPREQWAPARTWMTRRLQAVARSQAKITYGELCSEARAQNIIDLEPHGTPLAGLLGQINVLEQERDRPLISCVVVHATDDYLPGVGFWNMAKEMNLAVGNTEDEHLLFWTRELTRCHAYWKNRF